MPVFLRHLVVLPFTLLLTPYQFAPLRIRPITSSAVVVKFPAAGLLPSVTVVRLQTPALPTRPLQLR